MRSGAKTWLLRVAPAGTILLSSFCPFHFLRIISRITLDSDMSLALGKRKRAVTSKSTLPAKKVTVAKPAPPPPAPEPESDAEDKEALNDAFRRAFEKRFKAIEVDKPEEVEVEEQELDEDENEDWDGLSEEEEDDEDEVEVVEHNMSNFSRERADRAALKAFMVNCHFPSQVSVTRTYR